MKDEMRFHAIEWTPPHGYDKRLRRRKARSILRRAFDRLIGAGEESMGEIKREVDAEYEICSDPMCRFCRPGTAATGRESSDDP